MHRVLTQRPPLQATLRPDANPTFAPFPCSTNLSDTSVRLIAHRLCFAFLIYDTRLLFVFRIPDFHCFLVNCISKVYSWGGWGGWDGRRRIMEALTGEEEESQDECRGKAVS